MIPFIVASLGIAWLSRASLRNFRSHGFYRFFALEAILLLVWLNGEFWFYVPFSVHQIISWVLLGISLFLVIHGALLLHKVGKPSSKRDDTALIGLEKTTELVTVGAYRYIRHPLYSSLVFLAWGVFCNHPSGAGVSLAAIATFFLFVTAKIEEAENMEYSGAAYEGYMKQTRMFVPFLF